MRELSTERLRLSPVTQDDAAFVLEMLNDPGWLANIGDRGVRTLDDARRYIADRLVASYEKNGFGLWVVERKDAPGAIGICGLVKRDTLPEPDIGFAFLPEFWSAGYAYESAAAVKTYALGTLGMPRLLAITNDDNVASIRLVEKLGLAFVRMMELSPGESPVRLFALEAAAAQG